MSRPLIVGNGSLLVCMDRDLSIRDLYWPYVGLHNHLSGNRARIGLWAGGRFSWLSDREWRRDLVYEQDTLVTAASFSHPELAVSLTVRDCVHHRSDALLRRFTLDNHGESREFRLFLTHDFHIAETDIADTVFFNPFVDALVHFKRGTYLLMTARAGSSGIFEYSTGISGFGGAEGTWRDCEDGRLEMNPIAQGSVDSALSARMAVGDGETAEIHSWICVGQTLDEVCEIHDQVLTAGLEHLERETASYWREWSARGSECVAGLPDPIPALFRRSVLTIRTNIDNHGAIIAANDSDIMETARAHYSYMWPRDGALVAATLDRLGYQDITRRFFEFCQAALPKNRGVLMQKYSADGSWGATWHPWIIDGQPEIPFQEDSTALVLWALERHYRRYEDFEFVASLYKGLVRPCAQFLCAYRDPITGLPFPSYDLWEERRGIHAYTCGTLFGALTASASLASSLGDGHASAYATAADELRAGMETHLWDPQAGRFARRLIPHTEGYVKDLTVDSALHAISAFGAFSADDPRVVATMRQVISRLWVQTEVGGIARYESDYYFRREEDIERVPGNPWFICTLWAAQWYIAHAETRRDLTTALELLVWTASRALPSGILAEQLHPITGEPLSVAPLTWSHAEFVSTVLDYVERFEKLPP